MKKIGRIVFLGLTFMLIVMLNNKGLLAEPNQSAPETNQPSQKESKQDKKVLKICPYCKGSGKIVCSVCNGAGRIACTTCGGIYPQRYKNCTACNKTGTMPCVACRDEASPAKAGSGYKTCPICDGSGKYYDDEETAIPATSIITLPSKEKPSKKESGWSPLWGFELGLLGGYWHGDFDIEVSTSDQQFKAIEDNLYTQGIYLTADTFNVYFIKTKFWGTIQKSRSENTRVNTFALGPEFGLGLLLVNPYFRWGYGISTLDIADFPGKFSNSQIREFTFGLRTMESRWNASLEFVWRKNNFVYSPDSSVTGFNDSSLGGSGSLVLFNLGWRF